MAMAPALPINEIVCEHEDMYCTINSQTIKSNFKFNRGIDKKTREILFEECNILKFPKSQLLLTHPNLTVLEILHSKIPFLSKSDFKGFGALRELTINFCNLKYLPANLFENTPHLEDINLENNEIIYISDNILDPLVNLAYCYLTENPGIDAKYDQSGENELDDLKEAIRRCKGGFLKYCQILENKFVKLETKLSKNAKNWEDKFNNQVAETKLWQEKCNLQAALENPQNDDHHKNFSIKIGMREFKVNKFVLAAKSAKIGKLIHEQPDVDNLELKHISERVIEDIVYYFQHGNLPNTEANLVELYEASHKLQIDELMAIAQNLMLLRVSPRTALDVLLLCNKFDINRELKTKAFEEFKTNFGCQLPLELASNPLKLKKLMQAKLDMDQVVAAALRE